MARKHESPLTQTVFYRVMNTVRAFAHLGAHNIDSHRVESAVAEKQRNTERVKSFDQSYGTRPCEVD